MFIRCKWVSWSSCIQILPKGFKLDKLGVVGHFPDFGREKPYQLGVAICGVKHALDGCPAARLL